jgi:hypothetical protein
MAATSEIVEGALRTAGILDPLEQVSTEDLTEGLRLLNNLMHSWAADNFDLYTHTTLAATDTFPLADSLRRGFEAILAVEFETPFGISVSPSIKDVAETGWAQISATYTTDTKADFDGGLKDMPSQGRYWGVSDAS